MAAVALAPLIVEYLHEPVKQFFSHDNLSKHLTNLVGAYRVAKRYLTNRDFLTGLPNPPDTREDHQPWTARDVFDELRTVVGAAAGIDLYNPRETEYIPDALEDDDYGEIKTYYD